MHLFKRKNTYSLLETDILANVLKNLILTSPSQTGIHQDRNHILRKLYEVFSRRFLKSQI